MTTSNEKRIVYADNAATTPVSTVAFEAMKPFFLSEYGNPAAIHDFGHQSKIAVETSRKKIAGAIGALSNEIFFTSGGTESNNWAILGCLEKNAAKGNHIVTTPIEHSSIFNLTQHLEEKGYEVTYLPVDSLGQVNPEDLGKAIKSNTILVSVMMANNEIGTILNVKELCDITHKHNILFHTDAVQAVGHIPINVKKLGVDMLSMSAHKFGGPKGIGALYLRLGKSLAPLIIGGGQERGMRSGTTNTPGIIGMATAIQDSLLKISEKNDFVTSLRDRLIRGLAKYPNITLTGDPINRLPGIASFVVEDINGVMLVNTFSEFGICISAGSACSAASGEQSRILLATGCSKKLAANSIRFSFSMVNSMEDVEYILDVFPKVLAAASLKQAQMQIG